jgi:carbon monoxide dehydrogenase subunit G
MIEIGERIDVPATPSTVWDILSDPHDVVECVPDAALGEQHEDGSFDAALVVKFGPAKVKFQARVTLELDEPARAGTVMARGKDNQGGTRVRAAMHYKVIEQEGSPGSSIVITAEVEVTGRLATVVEGGAKLVTRRMTADFAERLAARCGANAASASP